MFEIHCIIIGMQCSASLEYYVYVPVADPARDEGVYPPVAYSSFLPMKNTASH